jgi:phospholipid-binding lipoprotein MlaA
MHLSILFVLYSAISLPLTVHALEPVPLPAEAVSAPLLTESESAPLTGSADAKDPLQIWNRKVYTFNEGVDQALLKPLATVYKEVVPTPIRKGVSNFFGNFSDAWSAVNNLLQGKPEATLKDFFRVATNTVFGFFGVIDLASEMGLERQGEDFGQTLGYWGVPSGPYVVLPIFGPSTVRDAVAKPFDLLIGATQVVEHAAAKVGFVGLGVVSIRTELLGASNLLDEVGLDKYTFVREAYLQRRINQVNDGSGSGEEEETESEFQDYQDEADISLTPVKSSASQPAQAPTAVNPNAVDAQVQATSTENQESITDEVDTANLEQLNPPATAVPPVTLKNKRILIKQAPASSGPKPRLQLESDNSESKKLEKRRSKPLLNR